MEDTDEKLGPSINHISNIEICESQLLPNIIIEEPEATGPHQNMIQLNSFLDDISQ